ncbi:MAG: histidine phosphatase family protein [Chloroflexota bacterium]|nr:MAG: histidine phosphatase family protein [Chloroflexota bacterium]
MPVNRVVLIRPGETDWNRQGRWQGWVATPLNEHGRRQARKLARFVRNIGMTALYSSDLRRAVETAEIITEHLPFEPIYDPRLRERKIGEWQGLTLDEMAAWYPEAYDRCINDPENFPVPGGESRNDVRKRIVPCFEEIVAQADGEAVGILSHTTAMKVLLLYLLPECDEREITFTNTSVTTLARDGERWRLVAVNDVMHLEGLETKSVGELEYGP